MKSRLAVACGALAAALALSGCFPQPTPPKPNAAPVAVADVATWPLIAQSGTLPFVTQQTTLDVLANDTDPDGNALVASGGGTWRLDGDPLPAGKFTVAADGTLTVDSGTDRLGPVQQLRAGEPWPATLQYTVSDGKKTATGTVTLRVVGATDTLTRLGLFSGPHGMALDFNDPVPTVFDARGCYVSPEGFDTQLFWQVSAIMMPPDPAFISAANVETVTVHNSGWGFGTSNHIDLWAIPIANQSYVSDSIDFFVGDAPGSSWGSGFPDTVPSCSFQSGRPYAPRQYLPTLDLRTVTGDTATFPGNVLTGVVDPQNRTLTAGGQGYIGDPADPHGTYRVNPDGTVTVTIDPDNPLPDGQQYDATAPYGAVVPDGTIGLGVMGIKLIGRG